ncbi:hypothetical protein D081_1462 [Anaerovibrio sp. JC8]|uniref:hypothetical protein n=1 Tax=Anaerovibrio sp. JC8 TaxID=1240085 RepID=UPI000A0CA888|nr:hypothetical protein [Anaerovibrio sp. JC8]ORT99881.1 hypothetical protein D081_1462 [Anaerovibrio sp. JC8]
MKHLKALKIFLLTLVMALSISGGTAMAGSQDFTLVNGTGKTIVYVYISPTSSSEWIYQDELGPNNVLYPGQDIFIGFSPRDGVQYWDLKVVYDNGVEDYWYGLDLYRVYSVTIRPGGTSSIEMA